MTERRAFLLAVAFAALIGAIVGGLVMLGVLAWDNWKDFHR